MGILQLLLVSNEIEASIIKGNLESVDIESKVIPINNNSPLNGSWLTAQDIPYGVYVDEDKLEEAQKFLKENK